MTRKPAAKSKTLSPKLSIADKAKEVLPLAVYAQLYPDLSSVDEWITNASELSDEIVYGIYELVGVKKVKTAVTLIDID